MREALRQLVVSGLVEARVRGGRCADDTRAYHEPDRMIHQGDTRHAHDHARRRPDGTDPARRGARDRRQAHAGADG
ncbi:hypothetical protein [Bradyrhizobium sp.]|uniref:hypothetical protein n=1 Tax=Bradyrhizobium sp. TaxID=376 RepID=UPI003430C957